MTAPVPGSLMHRLQQGADNVQIAMMGIMFAAFVAQVAFRYVLNLPLAWTEELVTFLWLWGILWGGAFVMRSQDDIRFDMLYNLLPQKAKRWSTLFSSGAIVLILLASLPGAWSYVSFMKVEKSAAMGIPMHLVFSIYLIFLVAMCVRHARIAWLAWNHHLLQDVVGAAVQDVRAVSR